MRETTLAPAVELALVVLALPFGLFLIALLFVVAGLNAPPIWLAIQPPATLGT